MLKKVLTLILGICALKMYAQVPFTPGNIVVYRVGDGSTNMFGNNAYPVFLDEYTPAGAKVQTIAMPTTASGSNKILTCDGIFLTGMMTLSGNGEFLVVPGVNATVGASAGSLVTSSSVPRMVGLVRYTGVVNTTTALTDVASNGLYTCAASSDGTNIWVTSNGGGVDNGIATDGVRYTTVGQSGSTKISGVPPAFRSLTISNGELYVSASAAPRISKVGSGLPTTTGQILTALPNMPTSGAVYQFVFFDLNPAVPGPDVLYLASDGVGLQKFSFDGTTWILNGTVGTSANQYFGLTGSNVNGTIQLFATRTGGNSASLRGGQLVTLTDNSGYNGTFTGNPTILADLSQGTSPFPANTYSFRGVAMAPIAPSPCGTPTNLSAINIIPTGATLKWNKYGNIGTYNYAVTASATPPLFGQTISDTFFNATGLITGNQYYFHVRSDCGNYNYSGWATIPFTPICSSPGALTVSNNVNGAADLTWPATAGSNGYQYALSTSATPPSTGTPISGTSYHGAGLLPVTTYYFHIRNNCGSGLFSNWATTSFTTLCFSPNIFSSLHDDNADFSWNKIPAAQGYEYALTYLPTPPVAGLTIGDTVFKANGLTEGSTYYFHVRTKCSNGSFSEWSTISVHTTGLEVYPNPVKNTLSIRLNGNMSGDGYIIIADVAGKMIKKIALTGNSTSINMSDVAAGIYMVRYFDSKNQYSIKILKK